MALAIGVATLSLLTTSRANAEAYFCAPQSVEIGTYRPHNSEEDFSISVHWPDSTAFWFDDKSGDVMMYRDGVAGALEARALKVPLPLSIVGDGSRESLVALMVRAEQCQLAEMGVLP